MFEERKINATRMHATVGRAGVHDLVGLYHLAMGCFQSAAQHRPDLYRLPDGRELFELLTAQVEREELWTARGENGVVAYLEAGLARKDESASSVGRSFLESRRIVVSPGCSPSTLECLYEAALRDCSTTGRCALERVEGRLDVFEKNTHSALSRIGFETVSVTAGISNLEEGLTAVPPGEARFRVTSANLHSPQDLKTIATLVRSVQALRSELYPDMYLPFVIPRRLERALKRYVGNQKNSPNDAVLVEDCQSGEKAFFMGEREQDEPAGLTTQKQQRFGVYRFGFSVASPTQGIRNALLRALLAKAQLTGASSVEFELVGNERAFLPSLEQVGFRVENVKVVKRWDQVPSGRPVDRALNRQ